MHLIDVHCHLESPSFSGKLATIIADAVNVGVIALITSSVTPEEWELSRKISLTHKEVFFAAGVHPWYIKAEYFDQLKEIRNIQDDKFIAIGEIGLDYKSNTDFKLQKNFFEDQLKIANELNKPVIVHCRSAFNELITSIKRIGNLHAGGVIHSYSGNLEITKQLIPYGFYFSFGGAITFRNSKKKSEVLHYLYPERILLETDSPDIPPVEKINEINVPANILFVVKAMSDILNKPEEEIARISTTNAKKIFNITV